VTSTLSPRRAAVTPGSAGARHARRLAGAGSLYVAAWVVGLLIAPAAPSATASDTEIHAYFVAHHAATLWQALLVHGIAGLALAVFVVSLARLLAPPTTSTPCALLLTAGLGAAAVSLTQCGLEIALNRHVAGDGDAGGTGTLFDAVNLADTIKLILLGVAIAAAARLASEAGAWPRWLRALGFALAPILIIGGLAFVIDSSVLTAALTASLLLLLAWVAAVSLVSLRRHPQGKRVPE
jgi:hypothetical protein